MNDILIKSVLKRALKTFCQTAVSMIVVGAGFEDVNWVRIISVSTVAFIASVLTNIGGVPEANTDGALIFENDEDGEERIRLKTKIDVEDLLADNKRILNMQIKDERGNDK